MRVTSGVAKGIRLEGPSTRDTRPMTDRAKEAVFDALSLHLAGARVLDLYAGSGSVAIEALSRGAGEAVLVEVSAWAVRTIAANLTRTGLQAKVEQASVEDYLARAPGSFDLVFMDPPWSLATEELEAVFWSAGELVVPGGMLVVSRFAKDPLPRPRGGLRLEWDRRYGDTRIGRYVKESP